MRSSGSLTGLAIRTLHECPPFAWLIRATASRHDMRNGRTLARLGDAEGLILKSTMREPVSPRYPAGGQRRRLSKFLGACARGFCGPSKVTGLVCDMTMRGSSRSRGAKCVAIPSEEARASSIRTALRAADKPQEISMRLAPRIASALAGLMAPPAAAVAATIGGTFYAT